MTNSYSGAGPAAISRALLRMDLIAPFAMFEDVRVRKLCRPLEEYDGWRWNQRPRLRRRGDADGVAFRAGGAQPLPSGDDMGGAERVTIWLGEFDAEALEPASER